MNLKFLSFLATLTTSFYYIVPASACWEDLTYCWKSLSHQERWSVVPRILQYHEDQRRYHSTEITSRGYQYYLFVCKEGKIEVEGLCDECEVRHRDSDVCVVEGRPIDPEGKGRYRNSVKRRRL